MKKVGWVLPHVSGEGFCGWDRCCPGEPHGALCESTGISHPASHTACICPVEGVTALSWIRQRGDVYESTVTAVRGYLANAADGTRGSLYLPVGNDSVWSAENRPGLHKITTKWTGSLVLKVNGRRLPFVGCPKEICSILKTDGLRCCPVPQVPAHTWDHVWNPECQRVFASQGAETRSSHECLFCAHLNSARRNPTSCGSVGCRGGS